MFLRKFNDSDFPVLKVAPRLGRLLVGGEENREKGIGKILIQRMIDENRKLNQKFIHLFVFEDNFPAIRCYESMGFKFDSEVALPIPMPNGSVTSALLMTLSFED